MNQIAIIDDSAINLELFKAWVTKLDDGVALPFQDAPEGLRWCSENQPDLVIVDYQMPSLNGLEFISRFRDVPGCGEIPVLMITATEDKNVRYQALDNGATDFLTKPPDRREFEARVRIMLKLNASRKQQANYSARLAEDIDRATADVRAREEELLTILSVAAEYRDPETSAHTKRMALFAELIAAEMGLPQDDQALILKAAPLHDIGKIGIADVILLKAGRLSAEEFATMKTHANLGYQLLKDSKSEILKAAAQIALSHHEKFDGSGYPGGLVGTAIPLFGRIVAVADVFDALLSARPYKSPWLPERAFAFLQNGANAHFDSSCVAAFLARRDEALEIRARFQDEQFTDDGDYDGPSL